MKKMLLCAKHEYRKALRFQKGLLIFCICLILHMALCFFTQPKLYEYNFNLELYQNYIAQFGGVYSQATAEAIDAEIGSQQEIANMPLSMETMSSDEYFARSEQILVAKAKLEALAAVKEKYTALEELQAYHAELVYDLEFAAYGKQFQQIWLALICIAVLTIGIVVNDRRCGMYQLLYSSKMGKSTILKGKLFAVGTLAFLIAVVFAAGQLILLSSRWNLGTLHAPIQSCAGFSECTLEISVLGALLLSSAIQVIASVVLALLLTLLITVLKNEILGAALIIMIIGSGVLFKPEGAAVLAYFSTYLVGVSVIPPMSASRLILIAAGAVVLLVGLLLADYKISCKK